MELEQEVYGDLLQDAVELNEMGNVDVFVCMQGNTKCVCVTVEDRKTVVYSNRFFFHDEVKLKGAAADIKAMLKYRRSLKNG